MERLPGFRDFFPEPIPFQDASRMAVRNHLFQAWRNTATSFGFQEYDGPPLESLELYTTKSGDEIVGQLYNFTDKGGREVALRPEMTPTLARMVLAGERHYKKPLKWFSIPQLFRYERQQKGRLREHFQFNADIIGESGPAADAELIALLIDSLHALGLSADDFQIRLSSRTAWQQFYQGAGGNPETEYAFFQVIDKLERSDPESSEGKLNAFGFSLAQVEDFIQAGRPNSDLERVLADLDARGLRSFVALDYRVIRGLAYYTGTVFEAFDRGGAYRAIAGGGRYDNLVKVISGGKADLPALGFGMGDVVLSDLLQQKDLLPKATPSLDLFFLIEDENLRPKSLQSIQQLRRLGLSVDFPMAPAKPNKQFKRALESGATATARLSPNFAENPEILVKFLATREERRMNLHEITATLRPKLQKH